MGPPPLPSQPLATTTIPAYLPVSGITDPKLRSIPSLDSFQVLEGGEQSVKSYQMRLRRPKYPWLLLLLVLVIAAPLLMFCSLYYLWERERYEEAYQAEQRYKMEIRRSDEREAADASGLPPQPEPIERTEYHDVRDDWWILLIVWELAAIGVVTAGFLILRKRGHTFLYLTNRRLIVLELTQSLVGKEQVVLNFNLHDISGFQLLAQRGLRKLLGILLLREKRTFYLSIATRTSCTVELGAVSTRGSAFEPGCDAVALCGELDAQVLALRAARAA
jgi:hypothetical protein